MDARVTCLYSASTENGQGEGALTGFGYVLAIGETVKEVGKSFEKRQGDLLRGHLKALIEGLKALVALEPSGGRDSVILVLDHEFLVKGLTEWMPNWKRNGWRNAKKQPVAYADLWQEADALIAKLRTQNADVIEWKGSHGDKPFYKTALNLSIDACVEQHVAEMGMGHILCTDAEMNAAIAGSLQVPAMKLHDVAGLRERTPKGLPAGGYDGLDTDEQRLARDNAIAESARYMRETGKLPWEA